MEKIDNLVSIVIPVSNREMELLRAIDSVLLQDYINFEVLIVINNSIDAISMKNIVEKYEEKRLQTFILANCDNANVARNFGISMSSGSFIAFLDSDDEWHPNHLSNCINLMISDDPDFIYGSALIFDGKNFTKRNACDFFGAAEDYLFEATNGFSPTPSYFIKKEIFHRVLWDETLRRHQDYDFFIRCSYFAKMKANINHDIVINWKKGERRESHFQSMLDFYLKFRCNMSISAEMRYLKGTTKNFLWRNEIANAAYFLMFYVLTPFRRFIFKSTKRRSS